MVSQRVPILAVAAVVAALGAAAPAHAQEPGDTDNRPPARPPDAPVRRPAALQQRELSDSVRRVERATRGRVLSAEAMQFDGRVVNRIKVLDDSGRVRVYVDDPTQPTPRPTRGDDD